jgi:hypothetical protein
MALGLVPAQQPDPPPFLAKYASLTYYYKAPDPSLGPRLLKDLLRPENLEHPWFKQRTDVLPLLSFQLGQIARGHPEIVRAYEAAWATAPKTGRRLILRSLMGCGDETTRQQLDRWAADDSAKDLRPEIEQVRKHLADPKRKGPRDRPAQTPHDLDMLWADFLINGEWAPVGRVLDVLDLPNDRGNEQLKRVALWSFESNLQQHPRLVELARKHVAGRPEASKKLAGEALKKVAGDKP